MRPASTPPSTILLEVWNAMHDGYRDEEVYALGQTLPTGFLSTESNPISQLRVSGIRDLGDNELASPRPPTALPGPGFLAKGRAGVVEPAHREPGPPPTRRRHRASSGILGLRDLRPHGVPHHEYALPVPPPAPGARNGFRFDPAPSFG
jgi:hypothetical protein